MRRRVLAGIAVGLALLVVMDALAARAGLVPGIVPILAGTVAWTTSRAAGVTAFLALTLELVFGLFVSTGAVDRLISRATSIDIHRWLSSVALALIATHALVLTLDPFVRFDVLDTVVPLLSSYRSIAVGLGILAAHGALVVHLSFQLRRRLGTKRWRKLHYLSFPVFAAALGHGLLAGSDTGLGAMQAMYVASGTLVGALALYRVVAARPSRSHGQRAQAPEPTRERASTGSR